MHKKSIIQLCESTTSQVGNCITPRPVARPSDAKTWEFQKMATVMVVFLRGNPYNGLEDLTFQSFCKNALERNHLRLIQNIPYIP